jgi:hypothetical protein
MMFSGSSLLFEPAYAVPLKMLASTKAGVSGWAVNDFAISPLAVPTKKGPRNQSSTLLICTF